MISRMSIRIFRSAGYTMMVKLFRSKAAKKLSVCLLIMLLSSLSGTILLKPSHADIVWTDIDLSVTQTISAPGNYMITGPWNGSGTALTIDANSVVVDGQNCLLTGDGNNDALLQVFPGCSNITLENINETNATVGLYADSAGNISITDSAFSENGNLGLGFDSSGNISVVATASSHAGYAGLWLGNSSSDITIADSSFCQDGGGSGGGIFVDSSSNISIANSTLDGNSGYGLRAGNVSGTLIVEESNISNNTLNGLAAADVDNATVTGNVFGGNGLSSFSGAVELNDSNCALTNNTFGDNHDGLLWFPTDALTNYVDVCSDNFFNHNQYTFYFDYISQNSNQKLHFFNNFVNDSAYVDYTSPFPYKSGLPFVPPAPPTEPNSNELYLNTTLHQGIRIYSAGLMLGGNFWANPSGTGYSQTGVDANHDCFVTEPFDLFGDGSVFDYLPYSTSYALTLAYIAGASQSLVAHQVSSAVTVQLQNYFGAVTSGITFNLASNSTTGKFYSDSTGTQQISAVTISKGSSSASFYYKDTAAGTSTITASATAANSAMTHFSIAAHSSTASTITISPSVSAVTQGSTVTFAATATDACGNRWDVTSATKWGITQGAGGVWNGNFYTAGNPGSWTVTATYGSLVDSTTLVVTAKSTSSSTTPTPTPTPTPKPSSSSTSTVTAYDNKNGGTYTVGVSGNITSQQMSNMTIIPYQSNMTTAVQFRTTGPSGNEVFCNITIPKAAIPYGTIPILFINGQQAQNQGSTQDAQNYYLWYTTHFSNNQMQIVFIEDASDSTPWLISSSFELGLTIIAVAIAATAGAAMIVHQKRQRNKPPA
jgi:hypothetical protein